MSEAATIVSFDDDVASVDSASQLAIDTHSAKRNRADSSPLSERSRMVITHKSTPFEHGIPRDITPADSEVGTVSSGVSDIAPVMSGKERRNKTKRRRLNAVDLESELAACIVHCRESKSEAYREFEDPVIKHRADGPPTHYEFMCKHCRILVVRVIGTSETSTLLAHIWKCAVILKQQDVLNSFGITSGNNVRMMTEEVREGFALWVATNSRASSQVNDAYLHTILHPNARKHKPHRETVRKDIMRMYESTQADIKKMLADHRGVFHLALDMCQLSNGEDFLSVVIFRQVASPGKPACIECFVLECLSFEGSHTGKALTNTTLVVMQKFEIQHRINNASNNEAMMKRFAGFDLKRLTGLDSRVYCMLHMLNLAAKAIAKPFRKKRDQLKAKDKAIAEGSQVAEDSEPDDQDEDDWDVTDMTIVNDDVDPDDDGLAASWTLVGNSDDEDDEDADTNRPLVELPEMAVGSAPAVEEKKAAAVLHKMGKPAHRLCFTPGAHKNFQSICVEKDVPTPHNIRHDMTIRFNSTEHMAEDTNRTWDAIIVFQHDTRWTDRKKVLHKDDRKVIWGLLATLKPLKTATEVLSRAEVSMLADVIVHYDVLNHVYRGICLDSKQALWIRHAARRAMGVLNKYYGKTDDSQLYRLALLMHPSMRIQYMKAAEWEESWIESAVDIAETCWHEHYKPEEAVTEALDTPCPFGYSSYLDKMYSMMGAVASSVLSPVHDFIHGDPIIDHNGNGKPKLLDPLVWWYGQRMLGNECDSLTQMALDILSTPATSMDVEHAFSFAGSTVSKRRHNLAPCTIQAMATLGLYAKAGLVKPGCLTLPHKAKGKGKE